MPRWFPEFQVATACSSCSPPDLIIKINPLAFKNGKWNAIIFDYMLSVSEKSTLFKTATFTVLQRWFPSFFISYASFYFIILPEGRAGKARKTSSPFLVRVYYCLSLHPHCLSLSLSLSLYLKVTRRLHQLTKSLQLCPDARTNPPHIGRSEPKGDVTVTCSTVITATGGTSPQWDKHFEGLSRKQSVLMTVLQAE
jgi:hypothetical protein